MTEVICGVALGLHACYFCFNREINAGDAADGGRFSDWTAADCSALRCSLRLAGLGNDNHYCKHWLGETQTLLAWDVQTPNMRDL